MKRRLWFVVVSAALAGALGVACMQQPGGSTSTEVQEPFKFGTFETEGRQFLGLILRDRFVVELVAAHQALDGAESIAMADDMKELAGRYQDELRPRIYAIVDRVVGDNLLEGSARPDYVHEVETIRTLAPILYPNKILNAAVNYYGHAGESSSPEEHKAMVEKLRQDRGNMPYLFHKPTTTAVIGDGEPIWAPRGRPNVDWECELGVVIGKPARYVTADQAREHIFGYTIEIDVSDRGGRGDERFGGSDWLIGKGHDTFAPLGPYVTPAEFIEDPMDLGQQLTVNGTTMQDARSSDMIFNVYELIEYGSSIVTLESGDVVAGGSPQGIAGSRVARDAPVPYLKPGDVMVASIEGIGSLTHEVIAEPPPPPPLYTGQAPALRPIEPFKIGTFEIRGEPTLGLVLRDEFMVELRAANQALERRPQFTKVPMAGDMKELAGRYHLDLRDRVYQIVNHTVGDKLLEGEGRPWYVHDLSEVRVLAPILYPNKILNAAGNYYGHVGEMNTPEEQAKAAEERRRDRGIPYLFIKTSATAVIGDGDDILMPRGRPNLDWECELAAVIGQPAKYVSVPDARNHIFGYTIEIDISSRGGRGEGDNRSDWFIGKGHDTHAPLGPFIVPAEFVANPMNLGQKLTVNGQVMQDSRSSDMIHNLYELIEYGSSILTLESGDVVAGGSPAGAGFSRTAREEPVFLKPGDEVVASIEGIGSLTHTVRGPDETGAAPTSR